MKIALPLMIWLSMAVVSTAAIPWIKVPPLRRFFNPRLGKILSDIESHMPRGHIYRTRDLTTWGHETTHGINNRIRNGAGSRKNAFYVLNDKAAVLWEPGVTINQVASLVPQPYRDSTYNLYLLQSRSDWNREPLYLMDEWVAYINGALVGLEMRTQSWSDISNAIRFSVYCTCLLQAVERWDSNFSQKDELAEFIGWNINRTTGLMDKAKSVPSMQNREHAALWKGFEQRYMRLASSQ